MSFLLVKDFGPQQNWYQLELPGKGVQTKGWLSVGIPNTHWAHHQRLTLKSKDVEYVQGDVERTSFQSVTPTPRGM